MSFTISSTQMQAHIQNVQNWMKNEGLDVFYVSSSNIYLNEYTPLEDCHRYYLTRFTGSTADVLVPREGRVYLFVDGRYHEQAEQECDAKYVNVYKCPQNVNPMQGLKTVLQESFAGKVLGLEGDRTPVAAEKDLAKIVTLKIYDQQELGQVIKFAPLDSGKEIFPLDEATQGKTTAQKLAMAVKENEAFWITASDAISWLSNCRGYQYTCQSQFMAKALVTRDTLYIQADRGIKVGTKAYQKANIRWVDDLAAILPTIWAEKVYYDPARVTGADERLLQNVFGAKATPKAGGITLLHSVKNPQELVQIRAGFKKADQAIYQSLVWAIEETKKASKKKRGKVSEKDFRDTVDSNFRKHTALDQSFTTIAAAGKHSSIIHYMAADEKTYLKAGEFLLLDCGGLFPEGFCTDTTRTIVLPGKAPTAKQKLLYTLVLKGMIRASMAVFTKDTRGSDIDALARSVMLPYGFNYNHGTGHGVGIAVHEGGIRFSPTSNTIIQAGQVVSIEPGIYLPGFGGVRIENIVEVVEHPKFKDMLCFKPLVYIGMFPALIDKTMLNQDEKNYLKAYEKECQKRHTSFGLKV